MAALKNAKHELFVQEYLIDLNQTQAAIRAGYSPKSATQQASELMRREKIRARVDELMADRARRTGVNADRVVRELARIAFVNVTDVIDINTAKIKRGVDPELTAAIQSVKVKSLINGEEREVRFASKTDALEMLGRHLGMFDDRLSVINTDDGKLDQILEQLRDGG